MFINVAYTSAGRLKVVDGDKLTITLSKKAQETLESLMMSSGFGSRGRTIEEAILAIDELSRLGEQIVPAFSQFSQKPPSQENALLFVSTFVSFLTWYFATLSRFKKVVRPPQIVSSPVSPNATTSGGRTTG